VATILLAEVQEHGDLLAVFIRRSPFEDRPVSPVHGQKIVKLDKVRHGELPGAQASEIVAAFCCGTHAALVRLFANVIAVRSCRIYHHALVQILCIDQMLKDPFCRGRTTDVAGADKQYPHRRDLVARLTHSWSRLPSCGKSATSH
jgi:hypothetical protein